MHLATHQQLHQLAEKFQQVHLYDLFKQDASRGEKFTAQAGSIWLNYSRNHLDQAVIEELLTLAKNQQLEEKRKALFSGSPINLSEGRAAQHTLLRAPLESSNPNSIAVHQQLKKMADFVQQLTCHQLISNTPVTDVVCIGIGGSELGPKLLHQALSASIKPRVKLHFVANIDGAAAKTMMRRITKESTIFLVTSKTFNTFETTKNFSTIKQWFTQDFTEKAFMSRCYAITANPQAATKAGFAETHIFEFWDWVGGRFSVWSSVGLPIAMAYGMDNFQQFLAGAHHMDHHFQSTDFQNNLPVLLALLHIWQGNYLGYPTRAVIPYAQKLEKLPTYLQQLEMESLGKSVDIYGHHLSYATSPIVWGSAGSNGQHAFFQLLHQGSQIVPVDFIAALEPEHDFSEHHNALLANCLAQSQSLMTGGDIDKAEHGRFNGNRPSNLILIHKLTPYCLGELLAMYEHKVFVQSVIWNINAFDQWGVELGKRLANDLLNNNNGNISFTDIRNTFRL